MKLWWLSGGLNPQKLGKLDNSDQEPGKLPLPDFILKLYRKSFGRERLETVRSIEEMAAAKQAKKEAKRAANALTLAKQGGSQEQEGGSVPAFDSEGAK